MVSSYLPELLGVCDRIFVMLEELWRQGTSILLTTHQLEEAEQRCDRIVILDGGRAIADGTLTELIADTVGVNRRVTFNLTGPGPELDGFALSEDRRALVAEVADVALELPGLLSRIREAGGQVNDLAVHSPSLHAVFIHLTGRELRE